jgi:hypothetical protein
MIVKIAYSRMGNWEYRLKNFEWFIIYPQQPYLQLTLLEH